MDSAAGEAIMAALLQQTNNSPAISLAAEIRLRNFRLAFLLLSPPHFARSLAHLRSLSLRSKALLLARLLHRSLSLLLVAAPPGGLRLRDFDSAVLLLAMCDAYDPSKPAPTADWRSLIARQIACAALRPAGLGGGWWPAAAPHIEAAARCRLLVLSIAGGKPVGAATAAAVMSLAAAEIGDCAICGEEVAGGAAMPCGHPFHWGCILEWLCERNTCPCCRFELPTADVCGEVERVWKTALKLGGRFS